MERARDTGRDAISGMFMLLMPESARPPLGRTGGLQHPPSAPGAHCWHSSTEEVTIPLYGQPAFCGWKPLMPQASSNQIIARLTDFFLAQREAILGRWVEAVKGNPMIPSADNVTLQQLEDHVQKLIDVRWVAAAASQSTCRKQPRKQNSRWQLRAARHHNQSVPPVVLTRRRGRDS